MNADANRPTEPIPPLPTKRTIESFLSRYLPRWMVSALIYGSPAATLVILGWLLFSSWKSLQEYSWNLNPVPLSLSFIAYAAAVGFAVLVWSRMLSSIGGRASWLQHTRAFCISRLGYRLPGPLLHIPGRLMFYQGQIAAQLILVCSGLELLVMLTACLIVSFLSGRSIENLPALIFGVMAAMILMLILPHLLRWVVKKGYLKIKQPIRFRDLAEWTFWHALIWILGAVSLFFIINTFYPLSITELPAVIGAWTISGIVSFAVAFLPMGLGLRELTLGLLLSAFIPTGIAVLAAVLSRFLLMVYDFFIAGAVYLLPHGTVKS